MTNDWTQPIDSNAPDANPVRPQMDLATPHVATETSYPLWVVTAA